MIEFNNLLVQHIEYFKIKTLVFITRYKPTEEAVENAKELFKRYASKNKNPITDEEAEMIVNDILKQAKQYNPKSKTTFV